MAFMRPTRFLLISFLTIALTVVSAHDTLPSLSWKMSKNALIDQFKIKTALNNNQLRTNYTLNRHEFILNFSLNSDYLVAYSLQYKGKSPKQAYHEMVPFFQDQFGPGEQQSNPRFSKFECKQNRSTDIRMMLMKDKLFILVTPKRKF